jgi:hypothetical protein
MSRKRPKIVEYVPELEPLAGPTLAVTHHTHYEPRHRPVKSTLALDIPEQLQVVEPTISDIDFNSVILDDGGLEQLEFEGQRREMHGLPLLHGLIDTPSEIIRKRSRTQGVSITRTGKTALILLTGSSTSHLG